MTEMTFQGTKNCSSNPNYPAATAGSVYVVSVAGKIGGAAGAEVGVGDQLFCVETAAEGTQIEVGSKWAIQRATESLRGVLKQTLKVINVEHYGADPSASDNHEAFERAMAAAVEAGRAVLYFPPTGTNKRWLTSKQIKFPLNSNIHFLGHGEAGEIQLTSDLLYGEHFFEAEGGESEPSKGNEHWFDGIYIKGLSKWYGSPTGGHVPGYRPCNAMGFLAVSGMKFLRCGATEFYAGWDFRENALCVVEQCKDANCFYGRYIGPTRLTNQYIGGGWISRDHESNTASWAAIGCHPDMVIEGTILTDENQTQCPYSFYREGPQGIGSGFMTGVEITHGAQEIGNSFIYDESLAESFPSKLRALTTTSMISPMINISLNPSFGIGQSQTLDLHEATGGTFRIQLPKVTNRFAGAETGAIKFNATNGEIQAAISAVAPSSNVYVTTEGSLRRIQITGFCALQNINKSEGMALKTESLTGTAKISELEVAPEVGPLVRPVTPQVVEIKGATGGTFTVVVKVGATAVESKPIKFNASKREFHEIINLMSNVTPSGVVVSGVGTNIAGETPGVYYVYFTGSLLKKQLANEITLSVEASSLTGPSPSGSVSPFETAVTKAFMHGQYAIEATSFAIKFSDAFADCEPGTEGFIRAQSESSLLLKGGAGGILLANPSIAEGKKVIFKNYKDDTAGRWQGWAEIDGQTKGGHVGCFLMSVDGPVEVGNLIASKGTEGRGVIYPAEGGSKRKSGNTAAKEVETLEIEHSLGVVPTEIDIQVAQSAVVGWVITEVSATVIKLKFSAKTTKEAKVYWTVGPRTPARPHAGFAYAAVPSGTAIIPIVRSAAPVGTKVLYDTTATTPEVNRYLTPSATAGKVTAATDATDHLVAVVVGSASAGKVAVVPVGGL